ncbi:phosphoribosylanthranilate isomerase [Pelagibacteraceae bacterium]|nr:phosphoribosylanthranilate isomerase [Pelagibacteraceae bacterium]
MKSNKIKVCGITDLSIANFCIDNQADYLGFVSYEHSPRNISLHDSKDIISRLSKPIDTVAVTVNANINDMRKIEDSGFNYIQLHGSEDLDYLDMIKKNTQLKIIKAFGISSQADFNNINDYDDLCDYFLLDAKPKKTEMPGGNAKKFDWSLLDSQNFKKEFFLSGGLNLGNLEIALKNNITSFFDVSSSVESSPGVKDKVRISDFINKVKTR